MYYKYGIFYSDIQHIYFTTLPNKSLVSFGPLTSEDKVHGVHFGAYAAPVISQI
ncbi:uncharacterized protein PHALS_07726 [Plasmopara halstedii]|uniref:Uncharacterized protein n=1 Tax=Plasmopara halstedii TaxID=4781 RepID=A0A0P1B6I0_PLAHL|nr:uncharacterized protein PHALS_07726 [Plasmopara halstedii]CEG49993.1 hypothetical protein PHALS_07726 [Plasmopara halstedii]|eukprot:XP_024586362.1 hypothetical protein PHALS_07726 [Plasmopara halstedii]